MYDAPEKHGTFHAYIFMYSPLTLATEMYVDETDIKPPVKLMLQSSIPGG